MSRAYEACMKLLLRRTLVQLEIVATGRTGNFSILKKRQRC